MADEQQLEHRSRFHQAGHIMESREWPRIGIVGAAGRELEIGHDRDYTNVVLMILGGDKMAGLGISPIEARQTAALLELAADEVEKRHGRSE